MKFLFLALGFLSAEVTNAQIDYARKTLTFDQVNSEQSFKLLKTQVSYDTSEVCEDRQVPSYTSTGDFIIWNESHCRTIKIPHPQHNLQLNASVKVTESALASFKEAVDFELSEAGKVHVGYKGKNLLAIKLLSSKEDIVQGAVIRDAAYEVKIFDRSEIAKMIEKDIQNMKFEAGKLSFELQKLPEHFGLKMDLVLGKRCSTWYEEIDLSDNKAVIVSSSSQVSNKFEVDFDELVKQGHHIYENKICARVRVEPVIKSADGALVFNSGFVSSEIKFKP